MMYLGIFAKTFDGVTPRANLAAAAGAGYAAVQYNMACSGLASMPDLMSVENALDVAAAAKACNVQIAAVSGTYNMIHPNKAVREKGHARLAVLAAHCKAMGAPLITLCTGTRDPDDQWRAHPENATSDAWRDLRRSMEIAVEIAERWDILLGIEPELANVINSAANADRLLQEVKSQRLKIVLDPANLFERTTLTEQRRLVSAAVDLLGEHIVMGHAKDRAGNGSVAAAGKGVVDFAHFVACLKAVGFAGPLVTHGLSAAEAPGVAMFLRSTLISVGVDI